MGDMNGKGPESNVDVYAKYPYLLLEDSLANVPKAHHRGWPRWVS